MVCTEEKDLLSWGFTASQVVWHGAVTHEGALPCTVPGAVSTIALFPRWWKPSVPGSARVRFEKPVKAVTPGQAAVFYNNDHLLGGGWIELAF